MGVRVGEGTRVDVSVGLFVLVVVKVVVVTNNGDIVHAPRKNTLAYARINRKALCLPTLIEPIFRLPKVRINKE